MCIAQGYPKIMPHNFQSQILNTYQSTMSPLRVAVWRLLVLRTCKKSNYLLIMKNMKLQWKIHQRESRISCNNLRWFGRRRFPIQKFQTCSRRSSVILIYTTKCKSQSTLRCWLKTAYSLKRRSQTLLMNEKELEAIFLNPSYKASYRSTEQWLSYLISKCVLCVRSLLCSSEECCRLLSGSSKHQKSSNGSIFQRRVLTTSMRWLKHVQRRCL